RTDAYGSAGTQVDDEACLPTLDDSCEPSGAVSEQEFVWPDRQVERAVGAEVMRDVACAEGIILFPFGGIRIVRRGLQPRSQARSNRRNFQGPGPDVFSLNAEALGRPQRGLDLQRVVVGIAGVRPVVRLVKLRIGRDPVFRKQSRRHHRTSSYRRSARDIESPIGATQYIAALA